MYLLKENGNYKIHTNLSDWELVPKISSGYDWCKTSIGLSASDIHLLTFNVAPNEEVGRREAEFVLRGTGVESIPFRVVQLGSEPEILVNIESKLLSKEAQTFTMKVTANVEYTLQNEEKWLTLKEGPDTRGMVESEYQYSVTANIGLSPRRDIIRINSVEQSDEPVVIEVAVEQEAANVDDVIPDDIKVKVESVGMIQGTVYGDGKSGPEKTIDGDLNTHYGSGTSAKREPIIFEYTLQEGTEKVDYVILHQRKAGITVHNQLTKGEIAYKSAAVTEWTKCGSFDESIIVPSIRMDVNVVKPTHFRLTFERTPEPNQGSVALAEFECYQKAEGTDFDLAADAVYFEDNVFLN